ncbi:bifunctional riboflavin kinase/FAD synthetase [Varibaculum cambriense]|nr:bifunctional riboflavin kinase/FAD synthetase [Varibaculum cambriense]
MEIWTNSPQLEKGQRSVAAIGIFDGVHKGHTRILKTVVERARRAGVKAVAITFDPHPSQLHNPENPTLLIQPLPDRLDAMAALGLDATWVVPYTWDLANQSPQWFIDHYFVAGLRVKELVVGEDMQFGRGNRGDIETLREAGRTQDFQVIEVADITDQDSRRYSSTRVRACLAKGDVEGAARILGRSYRLRGIVERGFRRGRQLGFPTANLGKTAGLAIPADGVYAGRLIRSVPGTNAVEHLPAAISVGTNPQFSGDKVTVEAHVLGRADLDLYDEPVAIDFLAHLRDMVKLESVEKLQSQMDEDLRACSEILGVPPAGRVNPEEVTAL